MASEPSLAFRPPPCFHHCSHNVGSSPAFHLVDSLISQVKVPMPFPWQPRLSQGPPLSSHSPWATVVMSYSEGLEHGLSPARGARPEKAHIANAHLAHSRWSPSTIQVVSCRVPGGCECHLRLNLSLHLPPLLVFLPQSLEETFLSCL